MIELRCFNLCSHKRAPINPEEQTIPFESNKGIAKTFLQKVQSEIRCNKDSTYMY